MRFNRWAWACLLLVIILTLLLPANTDSIEPDSYTSQQTEFRMIIVDSRSEQVAIVEEEYPEIIKKYGLENVLKAYRNEMTIEEFNNIFR